MAPGCVEVRRVGKSFPGVVALRDVDAVFRAGEVHALVGENGSGKSTLVKVLAGVHQPDTGAVYLDGVAARLRTPAQALAAGIAYVAQESQLAPELSIAENIFFGGRHPRGRWGTVDWRATVHRARSVLADLGLDLDPQVPVRRLGVDLRRMVEVGRALTLNARLLVMDEVTSALTDDEVERLFDIVRRLRARGLAIVFVSHRMDEVYAIADVATVLRDGRNIGTVLLAATSREDLVRMMVGRTLEQFFYKTEVAVGGPVLTVENLSVGEVVRGASLTVRAGEVVGLAGLIGSGRTELVEAICGIRRATGGRVLVDGRPLTPGSPASAIRAGLCLVPADRRHQGGVLDMSVADNLMLPRSALGPPLRLIRRGEEHQQAAGIVADLQIRPRGVRTRLAHLSGGNQQKVVLGRWLFHRPRVLVLDEPTNGVDVGAKAEIYRLVARIVAAGAGVLLVSSELPELLALADRVLVMYRGRIVREFGPGASQQEVAYCASGNV